MTDYTMNLEFFRMLSELNKEKNGTKCSGTDEILYIYPKNLRNYLQINYLHRQDHKIYPMMS